MHQARRLQRAGIKMKLADAERRPLITCLSIQPALQRLGPAASRTRPIVMCGWKLRTSRPVSTSSSASSTCWRNWNSRVCALPSPGPDDPRGPPGREDADALDRQDERFYMNTRERGLDSVTLIILAVADETQREMQLLPAYPSHARKGLS